MLVVVRKPGTPTGPAMVHPQGTSATVEHARECVRFFRERQIL